MAYTLQGRNREALWDDINDHKLFENSLLVPSWDSPLWKTETLFNLLPSPTYTLTPLVVVDCPSEGFEESKVLHRFSKSDHKFEIA